MVVDGVDELRDVLSERAEAGALAYLYATRRREKRDAPVGRLNWDVAAMREAGVWPEGVDDTPDVDVMMDAAVEWAEQRAADLEHGQTLRVYVYGSKGTSRQYVVLTAREDPSQALEEALARVDAGPVVDLPGLQLDPDVQRLLLREQALDRREAALRAREMAFFDLMLRERGSVSSAVLTIMARYEKMNDQQTTQLKDSTEALRSTIQSMAESRIEQAEAAEERALKAAEAERKGDIIETTIDRGISSLEKLATLKWGIDPELLDNPEVQQLLTNPKLAEMAKDPEKVAALRQVLEGM